MVHPSSSGRLLLLLFPVVEYINFTTFFIIPDQCPILRLCIYNIWIALIYLGFKTIASAGEIPIRIHNTICTYCSGWAANTEVILCAAMNMIKRKCIVGSYFIKLRNR